MGSDKPTKEPLNLDDTHLPKYHSFQTKVHRPIVSLLFVSGQVSECNVYTTPILDRPLLSTLQQVTTRVAWCFLRLITLTDAFMKTLCSLFYHAWQLSSGFCYMHKGYTWVKWLRLICVNFTPISSDC